MNPHLQPWEISADNFPADSFTTDQLEFLLGYGILAPSSHNTQPWLFQLHTMHMDVYADRRRAIRVVDPFDRELTISCGAVLYNIRVAAEYFGHQCKANLLPDAANPNLLAQVDLGLRCETTSEDVLVFNAITQRHTNRQPFRPDPVPEEVLAELAGAAQQEGAWLHLVSGEESRRQVADLVAGADLAQWADKHFREELAKWVRPKPDEARDGLLVAALGFKDWLSFAAPTMIQMFNRGAGQAGKDAEMALSSPVLAVLGTDAESTRDWLLAGQALQAVLLHARAADVWASFLNQPIEVEACRSQLAEAIGRGGFPQMLLRLGYGPPAKPTPRRSVRDVLLKHKSGQAV